MKLKIFLCAALLSSVALTGCSNNEEIVVSNSNKEESNNLNENYNTEEVANNSDISYEEKKVEVDETIILNEINKIESNIKANISLDSIKDGAKESFITLVDFIYFEEEIKGFTFADLKDETKEEILGTFNLLETEFNKCFPNFKEDFKYLGSVTLNEIENSFSDANDLIIDSIGEEKYDDIKENANIFIDETEKVIEESFDDTKDLVDDTIGNENIDKVIDTTKDVIESDLEKAGELYDEAKDKVKNWYLDFKNN